MNLVSKEDRISIEGEWIRWCGVPSDSQDHEGQRFMIE